MNSLDWSKWTGLMEWTTGLEHWSTGTLEPNSVTAGYALYPCITQLRQTLDSVSTWQKHELSYTKIQRIACCNTTRLQRSSAPVQ